MNDLSFVECFAAHTDYREAILAKHEVQTAQLIASINELVGDAHATIEDFWRKDL